MSRNSKNARLTREAKERSMSRKSGNPGPKATTPAHGKKRAWWMLGSYAEFVRGKPKKNDKRAQDNSQAIAPVAAA